VERIVEPLFRRGSDGLARRKIVWVPFDLNTVSMFIVLTLIVLFVVLWGFQFWREKREEENFKHPPREGAHDPKQ
jgi:hypothetical protein